MRRVLIGMISGLLGLAALPATIMATEDIVLRGMGSFHVGGRTIEISGKPVRDVVLVPGGPPAHMDPNGQYQVEQMYVQYFLPRNPKGKLPLLMWHGGGLTGATYESTPDGREGWLNMFIRKGWDIYISDAVERGRAGFASPDVWKGEPNFLTQANPFERFRIGAGPGSWNADPARRKVLPGNQFPVEAYENFTRQIVPRWLTTDDAIIAAYTALVDKVCPCVLLIHSQAGLYGFKVAQARPDKIKAVVAVEPAGTGDPENAAALKSTPVMMMYGDYIEQDARWPTYRKKALQYAEAIRTAGGMVDVVNLPEIGIKGNSHMLMMDKNNVVTADLIHKWLVGKGFAE